MKQLFVTVGTTEFDELLNSLFKGEVIQELKAHGFQKVVIQKGRGKFVVSEEMKKNFPFQLEIFDFKPSLEECFQAADFIITHCGAGTLLEGLKMNKTMCGVVNGSLMNNHQDELLDKLESMQYIYGVKNIADLPEKLKDIRENKNRTLKQYPKPDSSKMSQVIASFY